MTTAAEIREWLLATLKTSGLSARAWAKKAGISQSTLFRALKPDYEFITSSRTLAKLAAAAGTAAPDFRTTEDQRLVPKFLPVRGRVQAGHWIETDDFAQCFPASFAVAPNPRFADWAQWLEEVVGDSIDKVIPDGGYAHVVDSIDMGYSATDGDFVVVERRRDGGHLRERTIKQVQRVRGGIELWPRSLNPKWSEPLSLKGGMQEGEEFEIEIVGLVIGSYTPLLASR